MTTVVNQDGTGTESSSAGWIVAAVVIFALILLLFYGLPFIRSGGAGGVQAPSTQNQGGTQPQSPQSGSESKIDVNVPDKIDINTNK